jgi:hypothetical protein
VITFIKKLIGKNGVKCDNDFSEDTRGVTIIDELESSDERMELDARKKWRLSMAKSAMRDVFYRFGVGGDRYKFKILPIDERNHNFVILVDIVKHFELDELTTSSKLIEMEKALKKESYYNYGVNVHGLYWGAIDGVSIVSPANIDYHINIPREEADLADTSLWVTGDCPQTEDFFDNVSLEDKLAFQNAIKNGDASLPPIKNRGKIYNTDLAPFE